MENEKEEPIVWYDDIGALHRVDGPAFIHANGDRSWYRHGKRHREDGPAIEWLSENREVWYKDGKPYEPSAHELMLWKMKKKES